VNGLGELLLVVFRALSWPCSPGYYALMPLALFLRSRNPSFVPADSCEFSTRRSESLANDDGDSQKSLTLAPELVPCTYGPGIWLVDS